MSAPAIVVVIAAYNAEATIGRAVESALASKMVAEVFVVDDASIDRTAEVATAAANSDPRFKIVVQPANRGPSAARNLGISESKSAFIAILDADDYFIANRFEHIMSVTDWDLCADNLVFFSSLDELADFGSETVDYLPKQFYLDFQRFVIGNISDRKRFRGELGFLKPILSRSFLEHHQLCYDEKCRFGEDFALYTAALAKGARFKVIDTCGYAALVRNNSLSGNHALSDLVALYAKCQSLLAELQLTDNQRELLVAHANAINRKITHRQVLETRHRKGIIGGILAAARHPTAIWDILLDRFRPAHPNHQTPSKLFCHENLANSYE